MVCIFGVRHQIVDGRRLKSLTRDVLLYTTCQILDIRYWVLDIEYHTLDIRSQNLHIRCLKSGIIQNILDTRYQICDIITYISDIVHVKSYSITMYVYIIVTNMMYIILNIYHVWSYCICIGVTKFHYFLMGYIYIDVYTQSNSVINMSNIYIYRQIDTPFILYYTIYIVSWYLLPYLFYMTHCALHTTHDLLGRIQKRRYNT